MDNIVRGNDENNKKYLDELELKYNEYLVEIVANIFSEIIKIFGQINCMFLNISRSIRMK